MLPFDPSPLPGSANDAGVDLHTPDLPEAGKFTVGQVKCH